jgi:hypothetical protein
VRPAQSLLHCPWPALRLMQTVFNRTWLCQPYLRVRKLEATRF